MRLGLASPQNQPVDQSSQRAPALWSPIRSLLFLAILLLAGCTAPAPPPEMPPGDVAPSLANLREFHWATAEALGDTALEVRFDLGFGADCEVRTAASRQGEAASMWVALYEGETGNLWSSGGSGAIASAHAGPADTREVLGASAEGSGLSALRGSFGRTLTVTILAPGAFVRPDSPWMPDAAIGIDLECDQPFDVVGATIGHSLRLAEPASMAGGAGLDVAGRASVNLQDTLSMEVGSPRARAVFGSFGDQALQVVLDHPGGRDSWLASPVEGADGIVEGGPGSYSFTVDRAAAHFEAFWMAIYGLDEALDLSPGRRADPITDSPFDDLPF